MRYDAAMTDDEWMAIAIAEADAAARHADVPVGCVIVDENGTELARGHNRREVDQDPTAHAELVAMRAAAVVRGHWRLDRTTLYVTLEPCAMCAGALVNARVPTVVYGASDPKAGAVDTLFRLGDDERLNHRFQARGGIQAEACAERLRSFFQALRADGQK